MAAPQKRWNAESSEKPATPGSSSPESGNTSNDSDKPESRANAKNNSFDGHARSEDLLDEHDEDVDNALKTGLVIPFEAPDKAEAEAETKEFDDDETADEAAVEAEKADPDDQRNTP